MKRLRALRGKVKEVPQHALDKRARAAAFQAEEDKIDHPKFFKREFKLPKEEGKRERKRKKAKAKVSWDRNLTDSPQSNHFFVWIIFICCLYSSLNKFIYNVQRITDCLKGASIFLHHFLNPNNTWIWMGWWVTNRKTNGCVLHSRGPRPGTGPRVPWTGPQTGVLGMKSAPNKF